MIVEASDILTYMGLNAAPSSAWSAQADLIAPMADAAVKQFCGISIEQNTYTGFLPHQDFLFTENDTFIDVVNNRVALYGFSDTRDVFLPETPVRSISAIYADLSALAGDGPNDFSAETQLVEGTDFYPDWDAPGICMSGIVKRWINVWPARARCIKVTYTAGYTANELNGTTPVNFRPSPVAIRSAAILTAVQHMATALAFSPGQGIGGAGGITSERLGDAAFSYSEAAARLQSMQVEVPPMAQRMLQPFVRMMRR